MSDQTLSTLTQYGISFQIKTVTALLKNPIFFEQIYDIVYPDFYDADSMKWIVKVALEYYEQHRSAPTPEVFKLELEKNINNIAMKESIVEKLKSIYNNFNAIDLDYVQENFLKFTKNQVMKQAVLDSVDLMEAGKYEEIRSVIDSALRAGEERNIGVIWKEKDFFTRRIEDTLRSPIPTPWEVVNEIMDGGLGAGELGIIVAPGGIGKCVGKDTEIEIEYEEIGIDILDYTVWFNSWDKIFVNDKYMYVYEFADIISGCILR